MIPQSPRSSPKAGDSGQQARHLSSSMQQKQERSWQAAAAAAASHECCSGEGEGSATQPPRDRAWLPRAGEDLAPQLPALCLHGNGHTRLKAWGASRGPRQRGRLGLGTACECQASLSGSCRGPWRLRGPRGAAERRPAAFSAGSTNFPRPRPARARGAGGRRPGAPSGARAERRPWGQSEGRRLERPSPRRRRVGAGGGAGLGCAAPGPSPAPTPQRGFPRPSAVQPRSARAGRGEEGEHPHSAEPR